MVRFSSLRKSFLGLVAKPARSSTSNAERGSAHLLISCSTWLKIGAGAYPNSWHDSCVVKKKAQITPGTIWNHAGALQVLAAAEREGAILNRTGGPRRLIAQFAFCPAHALRSRILER
ncbi:MAG TPA: hypothetical protein VNZ22_03765 [Bacillota bacterium]|nr:hypothetical protein [Bacillota bacterium]